MPESPAPPPVVGQACAFCGRAGDLSREHVVAQWIAKVLNDMEPLEPEWWTQYQAGGLITRDREHPSPKPGPTVVVRAVCTSCNGGWMSAMEATAKPVLEPMIRGDRTVLGPRQQLDIAGWAAKTVVALEQHEPSATITLPSDRELIMKERRPPHHYRVRLAYRDAYLEPLVIKTLVARSAEAPDERPNVFVTLLAIGFLIVHVWGGHGADLDAIMTQAGTKTGRAIMVWPPVPGDVEWPPVTPVGDDSLDEFTAEAAPWHDDSPGMAEWRAMRRAASGQSAGPAGTRGSETQPDVGSQTG